MRAPDPNGRWTARYLSDLAYRQAWDDAHKKARAITSAWNAGEYAISELPADADDHNTNDYY